MNDYRYEDLKIGMTESFDVSITEQMLETFRQLSGDENPLHCDATFAQGKGYPSRVCYGMLTASFFSTLGGVYLPGKNCLIHSVEVNFKKPVFIGDRLTILGEVTELNEMFRRAVIKVTITNQKNEKVSRGILKVGVLDEE